MLGPWPTEVTIEKNRISTSTRAEDLKSRVKADVLGMIQTCLKLLHENGNIAEAAMSQITFDKVNAMTQDELMSSPSLAMQLRCFLAHRLFDSAFYDQVRDHEQDDLNNMTECEKAMDLDPFLGAQEEMRKPQAVLHIDKVLGARDNWPHTIKTETCLCLNLLESCGTDFPFLCASLSLIQSDDSNRIKLQHIIFQSFPCNF